MFACLAALDPTPDAFARVKEQLLRNVRGRGAVCDAVAACDVVRGGGSALLPLLAACTRLPICPLPLPTPRPQYRNVNMSPAKHATYQRLLALKDRFWHADQVAPELERMELADVKVGRRWGGMRAGRVLQLLQPWRPAIARSPGLPALPPSQAFLPMLLEGLHVEAMLHGNITAGEATELARSMHAALGGAALPADARTAERCVQLPQGCNMLHRCGKGRRPPAAPAHTLSHTQHNCALPLPSQVAYLHPHPHPHAGPPPRMQRRTTRW